MKSKYVSDAVTAFRLINVLSLENNSKIFAKVKTSKSTLQDVKQAVVAGRAIRSLKNIIYRYMEEKGDNYIHQMDSFVSTMNTRVNRSIGKPPKNF